MQTFYGLEFQSESCQRIRPLHLLNILQAASLTFSVMNSSSSFANFADQKMSWTDRELTAWLDELLPATRMAEFEAQLRTDKTLQARVAQVIRHRDQGGNTIGEVWQRGRLSCPSRTEMGGYLLGTLNADAAHYVEFHLQTVGCRVCQANLHDLEEQSNQPEQAPGRRRRFFESSAGLLRNNDDSAAF